MHRTLPLKQVVATGEVQGGRQRAPHMKQGRSVPYLRVANVFDGYIDFADLNRMPFKPKEIENYRLKRGDILLNEGQSVELVGRCAMYVGGPEDCCFQNTLIRYRSGPGTDAQYALQLFRYCQVIGVFSRIAVKTNSIAHLGVTRFAELELPFPALEEQRKIAAILCTWDEAIEKADALIAAKRSQYVGIRRILIDSSQKQGHAPVRLTEITNKVHRPNDGKGHPVLTISAKAGFLLQSEKYSRDMAGSSVQAYTVLHRGEFAYNKGNSLTSPQGCIFRLTETSALVPHVYFCFALNSDQHPEFYVHVFESGHLNHQLSRVINSGVRNDGLLNLATEDFFNCRVPLPSLTEQIRIAGVLNGLKSELERYEQLAGLLRKQKRGLMQKLLTGEWRVKV